MISTPAIAQELNAEAQIANVPDFGKVQTVSVGTTIHEYKRTYSFNVTVPNIRMTGGGSLLFPAIVEADTPMFPTSSKTKFKACTKSGECGYDDNGDGVFDRMSSWGNLRSPKLKIPVPYRAKRITVENPDSVRQIIIYAGATGDTLRLSYREFSNDLARPAFTEELIIPITKNFPQDVAVKQVEFRIHQIDGLGMKYEILP